MSNGKIRIDHEIDFSKSIAGAKQMEKEVSAAHGRLDKSVKSTSQQVRRAAPAITGAMSAMTAGVAAQQQAWVSLGGTLLASFAAGGLIGGAIAGVGALVGVLAKGGDTLDEKFLKRLDSMTAGSAEIGAELAKLNRQLLVMQGVDVLSRDVDTAKEKFKELEAEITDVNAALQVIERKKSDFFAALFTSMPGGESSTKVRGKRFTESELRARHEKLSEALEKATTLFTGLERKRAALAEIENIQQEKALANLKEQLGLQNMLLDARTDFAKFEAQIERADAALRKRGLDPRSEEFIEHIASLRAFHAFQLENRQKAIEQSIRNQIQLLGAIDPKEQALIAAAQQRHALEGKITAELMRQLQIAQKQAIDRQFPSEWQQFLGSVRQQTTSALAAGTMAGLIEGAEAARGVFQSLLANIGQQALERIFEQILDALAEGFSQKKGGGSGSDDGLGIGLSVMSILSKIPSGAAGGFVPRPTLARVGDDPRGEGEIIASPSLLVRLLQEAGLGGGGGDIRIVFDAAEAFDQGARGNRPMIRAIQRPVRSRNGRDFKQKGY